MTAQYLYWFSTGMLSMLYLSSALIYATRTAWVRQTLADLQYPAPYLVPFMIIIKVLAALAILSRISVPLSDLAYAGVLFHLILSGMAHLGVRKPRAAVPAIIGLALLATSFTTQNTARDVPSPNAQSWSVQH